MATSVAQLNTRLDENLKRAGNAVFARQGLNPSEVVRAVWQYAVEHQTAPDFVLRSADDSDARLALAREGCGMAVRLTTGRAVTEPIVAGQVAGTAVGAQMGAHAEDLACARRIERDAMYDDMLDEMESRCR